MIGVAISSHPAMDLVSSSKCMYASKMLNDTYRCKKVGKKPESDSSAMSEVIDPTDEATSSNVCVGKGSSSYKLQLEHDVCILRQRLHEEIELHEVLEKATETTLASPLTYLPLPNESEQVQELLSTLATLEAAISSLEQQIVSQQYQISQERNERRLAEYRWKGQPSQLILPCSSDCKKGEEDLWENHNIRNSNECSTLQSFTPIQLKETPSHLFQPESLIKSDKDHILATEFYNHPNLLSEEMVRCMKNIFISLADTSIASSKSSVSESFSSLVSPRGHFSSSSLWSSSETSAAATWVPSPQVDLKCGSEVLASEHVFDPYRVRGKLSWADIGNYGYANEVSWMSVGKKQLEFAGGALRKFRFLVEQLAKVNPTLLRSDEKLAFWINLYNALIMHAYLAYGVPRSDLKLFSLMQKAAYTVGGHSLNAVTIEYAILKMKPPSHRPQTALLLALHKLKLSEEQKKFAVDAFEPLVLFALSLGMYSSPGVRVYTAANVREELHEAQRDFIRASVGVSDKGKLLVPKSLHCFARSFVDDAGLAVWISQFLPSQQAIFVEQCISQRRQSFLGTRNCGILPFDSRFRYIFLPETLY